MAKVRADLHYHVGSRGKRIISPDEFINVAVERLKHRGVVGISHFGDAYVGRDRYEIFVDEIGYEKKGIGGGKDEVGVIVSGRDGRKIIVINGQEVVVDVGGSDGHLLVLGIPRGVELKTRRSLDYSLDEADEYGATKVLVHGFYIRGIGKYVRANQDLLEKIDAIELFNAQAELWIPGFLPRNANKKARRFYHEVRWDYPHLGATAFSDGDSKFELGRNYTRIKELDKRNPKTLVDSLKQAVREAREEDLKMKPAKFGAVKHAIEEKSGGLVPLYWFFH